MFELDLSSKKPLYKQIVDGTKDMIGKNILREEDKMPSVRELAGVLKVNMSTIQKAYNELERENIIHTVVGRGTFITNNLDNIKLNYDVLDNLIVDLVREARILGVSKEMLVTKIEKSFEEK